MKKTGNKQGYTLEKVKTANLKPGPVVHEKLPDVLVARIINYKNKIKEVEKTSIESTLLNFQRDLDPEAEIEIWEWIANTYETMVSKSKGLNPATKRLIFDILLNSTLGVTGLDVKNSKV